MAKQDGTGCLRCGQELPRHEGRGRPRKYCPDCAGRQSQGWWRTGAIRQCDECGTEYRARHPRSRYCSRSCQCKASKDRRASLPHTHTCKGCGKAYTPRRADANSYCTRECAFADWTLHSNGPYTPVRFRACTECGRSFVARTSSTVCGEECWLARHRRKIREYEAKRKDAPPRPCAQCGTVFAPEYGNKRRRYCSERCHKRAQRPCGHNHDSRARHYGVERERVDPIAVFERDGWRCQICGKDTPRARRGSCMSNAPELDHRVPMSKGGGHLYSNTQTCCRACNGGKGNASNIGQLPLTLDHSSP